MVSCRTLSTVCYKNQSQWVFACYREVGELHAPKPFIFHNSRGGPVPFRDPRACSAGKKSNQYLKKEFRSSARRFFEEFASTVLSTVAARSKLGQGVSCFCPEIIIGGGGHSAFFLFRQLLDGLLACGWEKGSDIEACKAEFQSFVNDQRQLE